MLYSSPPSFAALTGAVKERPAWSPPPAVPGCQHPVPRSSGATPSSPRCATWFSTPMSACSPSPASVAAARPASPSRLATDLAPAFPGQVWLVELGAAHRPRPRADRRRRCPRLAWTRRGKRRSTSSLPSSLRTRRCSSSTTASTSSMPAPPSPTTSSPPARPCASSPPAASRCRSRASVSIGSRPLPSPTPMTASTLDAIARSPAVQLFVARAQAVAPAFPLTAANAPLVARICARLDGIPLALELAAAWVAYCSPAQILDRLDDSLPPARRGQPGRADAPADAARRPRLERCAVHRIGARALPPARGLRRGFTLEAAEAVCADTTLPSADVLALADPAGGQSLVAVTAG